MLLPIKFSINQTHLTCTTLRTDSWSTTELSTESEFFSSSASSPKIVSDGIGLSPCPATGFNWNCILPVPFPRFHSNPNVFGNAPKGLEIDLAPVYTFCIFLHFCWIILSASLTSALEINKRYRWILWIQSMSFLHSLDWFDGRSTGNHQFLPFNLGFALNFPINQSNDPWVTPGHGPLSPWVTPSDVQDCPCQRMTSQAKSSPRWRLGKQVSHFFLWKNETPP